MNPCPNKPDVARILQGLKDFQLKTVDYVFSRLYEEEDCVNRFLIADEVGLGKTLVARGILAKAIEQLWDRVPRIDVVYICANRDIARQNLNRLNVTEENETAIPTRMTLLPKYRRHLHGNKINFVSFTPGTSFNLRSSEGIAEERVLLYCMLRECWEFGNRAGPKNLFQCGVGLKNWRRLLKSAVRDIIDPDLKEAFFKVLEEKRLRERFNSVVERFAYYRKHHRIPQEDKKDQHQLIGELRSILAQTCVSILEPDIVILDEFQRFKDLLDSDNEISALARAVFDYPGAKVLLLSATPYKMFTHYDELEVDNHYADFIRTARFLFNSEEETSAFEADLARYRRAIKAIGPAANEDLVAAKGAIQHKLRRVMVRTERLSATTDRDGMISEVGIGAGALKPQDLQAFALLDNISALLGVGDTVEYWKASPYLLNVMDQDSYKIKKALGSKTAIPGQYSLAQAFAEATNGLLTKNSIDQYQKIDPCNAKLRALIENKVESGAWRLLWIPPSLPYYSVAAEPYGDLSLKDFTKALVFSAWQVVPKVIAMLTSYEAERRMVLSFDPDAEYATERRRRRPLLRFAFAEQRPTGMSVFPLIYPCLTLAARIDPLEMCAAAANKGGVLNDQQVLQDVETMLDELLHPIVDRYSSTEGPADEKWYWAALAILDKEHFYEPIKDWLLPAEGKTEWRGMVRGGDDADSHFSEHIEIFTSYFERIEPLGPAPADLSAVLAKVALASPAVAALRSFLRASGGADYSSGIGSILTGAASVGMGFRTLFNLPESMTLLRGLKTTEDTRYWESVLDYCVNGNLQAVMDEYTHILVESLGVNNRPTDTKIPALANEIARSVSIRTVNFDFDEIIPHQDSGTINLAKHSLRCRFALRFGDSKSEEDGWETRADQVRAAFNSPFRPFVLATTSIGQEGLDFHQYCHEIYHWNLPSNPVDLEQREGRIHRYKGHVIRRNLAKALTLSALGDNAGFMGNPWDVLFELARQAREQGQNDLIPYWIYEVEDGYKLIRNIPTLPLSRDEKQMEYLRNSLVAYRMVLGQPSQEDLLSFLQQRVGDEIALGGTPEIPDRFESGIIATGTRYSFA